jgi:hypothetical protein
VEQQALDAANLEIQELAGRNPEILKAFSVTFQPFVEIGWLLMVYHDVCVQSRKEIEFWLWA